MSTIPGHPRVPYATSICTPGIGAGEAGYLHGVWESRSPVTALVVVHMPASNRVLDIPSPLSPSSFWVSVIVSVRRCCRFSGLHAFDSSSEFTVGIRRPTIVVLVSHKAQASSTLALLQCAGHGGCHNRLKSTSENDTRGRGQTRSQTSSALQMVRLPTERDYRALSRWMYYALCLSHSHCASWCRRHPQHLHCLRDNNRSVHPKSLINELRRTVYYFNPGFVVRMPGGGMYEQRVVSHLQNITILSPGSGPTPSNRPRSRSRGLRAHGIML